MDVECKAVLLHLIVMLFSNQTAELIENQWLHQYSFILLYLAMH